MNRSISSASLRLCGLLLFTVHCSLLTASAQTRDFTRHVNPFIGTGGHGHTFPGATMPFGMVQLSPDTRIDNWDGSSGYHYSDDIIYGFSHTHLSGTGIPDGCDILFMPTVSTNENFGLDAMSTYKGFPSSFSHADEKAEPGYYSVKINDKKLLAELTATTRVGLHRYTFSTSKNAGIFLDLLWRDKTLDADIKVINRHRIEGFRRSSSWAKDQVVYFVAEFSKNFIAADPTGRGDDPKWSRFFRFQTRSGEQILLKVALSPVSIEGARKNLEAEMPGWDFEKVRADAKAAWNKELNKIEVFGGTPEQTTNFYTALYHTMIHPSVFSDVDGRYRRHDGKIHELRRNADALVRNEGEARKNPYAGGTGVGGRGRPRSNPEQYTVFSLWDTFRAAHPLYTIIDQRRTVDFINTFIRQYEQGGRLPVWELWGEETDTMIGYHAVSVIADAMAKGIKGFDYEKAYAAAKHSAELDHFGLAAYKKRGYISMEDENESVSKTLEYAYNDWCIARMAQIMQTDFGYLRRTERGTYKVEHYNDEYKKDFELYSRRARYFENLFDPKTGFFRPKKNGGFVEPFAPNEVTFGFTEGNSWQYSFFVPHDVTRLMELMGGREKFVAKLDELFTTNQKLAGREQADLTGLIGQYAHGNEPSHHIPYLYNYAGQSWKTQKYVRKIMDEFYKNTPDGLIGNEDCGQMSAWYVLSASGIYPVNPGDGIYAFGTPLFPEVKYNLENGKTFTIRAKDVSDKNIYIGSARLNGAPYTKAFITHEDLMNGGVFEFDMVNTPNIFTFSRFPESKNDDKTLPVPAIRFGKTTEEGTEVFFDRIDPMNGIFFTSDGSDPRKNGKPNFGLPHVKAPATIRAFAVDDRGVLSMTVEAFLHKLPNDWTVRVISPYSTQYTGGGDNAIVDGIRRTVNFASGEWQGIQGKPYEAVVDLQRETEIKSVGGSFLQVASPWIWMPDRIEFETSMDGVHFTRVAEIKPAFPVREMTPTIREYRQPIKPTKARYVRLRAFNFGKIPAWHLGAGGDPWIFIDEIFID